MNATFSPDELAGSCYRAFCQAAGHPWPPWEHLALEHQAPWLRLALGAEAALSPHEGGSFADAGAALAALQCGRDGRLLSLALYHPANRLCYEAVARHLMSLLDAESPPDVGALERSWGPWAARRAAASNHPTEANREPAQS